MSDDQIWGSKYFAYSQQTCCSVDQDKECYAIKAGKTVLSIEITAPSEQVFYHLLCTCRRIDASTHGQHRRLPSQILGLPF